MKLVENNKSYLVISENGHKIVALNWIKKKYIRVVKYHSNAVKDICIIDRKWIVSSGGD